MNNNIYNLNVENKTRLNRVRFTVRKSVYRYFFPLFIFVILAQLMNGCDFINPAEKVPGYVNISSFILETKSGQGNGNHEIIDVWLNVNGQIYGVYELPAIIPIAETGMQDLEIYGGINSDGVKSLRSAYPFYAPYKISLDIQPGIVSEVKPIVSYYPKTKTPFPVLEAFDNYYNLSIQGSAQSAVDTFSRGYDSLDYIGRYGIINTFEDSATYIDFASINKLTINNVGTNIYLELNYFSNMNFYVGVYVHPPAGGVLAVFDLTLIPNTQWRKIYVNLTDEIMSQVKGSTYKIVFRGTSTGKKDANGQTEFIALDNIKLVYAIE